MYLFCFVFDLIICFQRVPPVYEESDLVMRHLYCVYHIADIAIKNEQQQQHRYQIGDANVQYSMATFNHHLLVPFANTSQSH